MSDICRDVWIMDKNVIYVVFSMMESCYMNAIYCVLFDGKWKCNVKMDKKIHSFAECGTWQRACALGKARKLNTISGSLVSALTLIVF